jgi:hypothetical protein
MLVLKGWEQSAEKISRRHPGFVREETEEFEQAV